MAAAPGLVSVLVEVNTGSASGIVSLSGSISGIADGFVSPLLFFERALKIIIIARTHIIAIAVIEMFAMVAVVMEFWGLMAFAVVVLVVVATVVVDVMVLAAVVVAGVTMHAVDDIDPEEPVNMLYLFAFECTQETPQSTC